MLRGIGGDVLSTSGAQMCCDVCTPDILQPGPLSRAPPRKQVRHISDVLREDLKSRLSRERELILDEYPGLKMFGKGFIFPDSTISLLCKEAEYIETISDLSFYGISRLDIQARVFNIIIDLVADAPPPKRRRKK